MCVAILGPTLLVWTLASQPSVLDVASNGYRHPQLPGLLNTQCPPEARIYHYSRSQVWNSHLWAQCAQLHHLKLSWWLLRG